MPPQEVAACEDEAFHPEICLVAIEPVSNFILLERYAPDRTVATWTQALETLLKPLRQPTHPLQVAGAMAVPSPRPSPRGGRR